MMVAGRNAAECKGGALLEARPPSIAPPQASVPSGRPPDSSRTSRERHVACVPDARESRQLPLAFRQRLGDVAQQRPKLATEVRHTLATSAPKRSDSISVPGSLVGLASCAGTSMKSSLIGTCRAPAIWSRREEPAWLEPFSYF